jgi:D-alanyl-lipoteichoic acid acyltransferase DltB (MBOAT superfamily)
VCFLVPGFGRLIATELLLSRDRETFRLRNMAHWKIVLNWIAAFVAVIAASLWFRSATVKIPANPPPRDENGMFAAQITVNDSDFIATAVQQTRWNKWAALAAGIAAACQAVALMLPT